MKRNKTPGDYDGPLTFINRGPALGVNVGSKDYDEAFSIQSHVTKVYRAWRKDRDKRRPVLERHQVTSTPKYDRYNSRFAQHGQRWRTLSPYQALGNGNLDPFNAAALPITSFSHALIDSWKSRYMFFLSPLKASGASQQQAVEAWRTDLQDMIADEMVLHGVYAGALLFMSAYPNAAPGLWRRFMFHQSKCLQLLRQNIATTLDEKTLVAVCFLATVDFLHRDMSACKVHVQAMKNLSDALGGLQSLSFMTRRKLYLSDLEVADSLLRKPVFPVSTWGTGSLADLFPERYQQLRAELRDRIKTEAEWPRCLRLHLECHREFVLFDELAPTLPDTESRDQIYEWLHQRKHTLAVLTLELYDSIDQGEGTRLETEYTSQSSVVCAKDFEKALVLAVNYLSRLIYDLRYENAMSIPMHHLQSSLEVLTYQVEYASAFEGAAGTYRNSVHIWILFAGACIERARRVEVVDSWFARRFLKLVTLMCISQERLVEDFTHIIYDDKLQTIMQDLLNYT